MPLRRSTTFTIHALDRVAQRLTLPRDALKTILDDELAVTLGVDQYSNRLHRLFYSPPDEQFFVAVQDAGTGDVVTVLPLDYYANLHGFVLEKHIVQAAALMGQPPPNIRMMRAVMPKAEPGINTGASQVRISGVTHRPDAPPLIKNLGSWPANQAPIELVKLADNPRFLKEMQTRARAKGFELRPPFTLRLQMGSSGDPVSVEIDSLPEDG